MILESCPPVFQAEKAVCCLRISEVFPNSDRSSHLLHLFAALLDQPTSCIHLYPAFASIAFKGKKLIQDLSDQSAGV